MAQEERNNDTPQGTTAESKKTLSTLLEENKTLLTAISLSAAFSYFLINQSQNINESLEKTSSGEISHSTLLLGKALVYLLSFFGLGMVFVLAWELLEAIRKGQKRQKGQKIAPRVCAFEVFLTTIFILICLYWVFNFFLAWSIFISSAFAILIAASVIIGLIYIFQNRRKIFNSRKN
jgi:hypothetical protein